MSRADGPPRPDPRPLADEPPIGPDAPATRAPGRAGGAALASDRAGERRYRLLARAIPQIVWLGGPGGGAHYFNPRWSQYTGLDKPRSRGRRWLAALHPEDRGRLARALARAAGAGEGLALDVRLRRSDGAYRWHLLRALPSRGRDARAVRWLGTFTDIDDQKRAEGALALLAQAGAVLASSLDVRATASSLARLAVPLIADACRIDILDGEDGAARRTLLGDGRRTIDGDPAGLDDAHPAARVLRSGRVEWADRSGPGLARRGPGEPGPWEALGVAGAVSYICAPLVSRGRTLGALSLVMAASGRRYGPADLALAEQLAHRVALAVDNARLFEAAERARRAAEDADRAKGRFLATLSHELRTPLAPVLMAATALLEDPTIPPALRSMLEMTRRNVELEARLIGDLLDLSRIGAGKLRLDLEPADAHEVIWRALEACREATRAAGLVPEVDLAAREHHVLADAARLQQVVWNLVKNAAKFTPPGGRLALRTSNAPGAGGEGAGPRLVIEVEDTGVGIDPALLPRVFDAFEQGGEEEARRHGGLGLGLAIGRAVAEAHGGRLTAASPGRGLGATFTLELPTAPAPAEPADPPDRADRAAVSPLRILLVEDNRDTLRNIALALELRGHAVVPIGSLAAAAEAAAAGDYDLVISDIQLGDGSGLDLMRRAGRLGGVPAIALSGYGTEEDARESRAAGFREHLTKPVTFQDLEAAIRRVTSAAPPGDPRRAANGSPGRGPEG